MKTQDNPNWLVDEDREDSYELWDQEKEFQEPKVPEEFVAPPTPPAVSLRGRTLQVRPLPHLERQSLEHCFTFLRRRWVESLSTGLQNVYVR